MIVISTPLEHLKHVKSILVGFYGRSIEAYNREKGVLCEEAFSYVIEEAEKETTDIIALAGGCYGRCLE